MSRLVWHKNEDRTYQTGVDRGVLYPSSGDPVPWNGLINVTEQGSQTATTYYRDGIPYLTCVTPRAFSAQLSAYTYPDVFGDALGIVEAGDGLFLDSQTPDQFDLSYRTFYGDGESYKIHIIYGATAVLSDLSFSSIGDSADPTTFEFSLTCTPQKVAGYRPTGHIVIDTRNLESGMVTEIENLIYGTFNETATLPPIDALIEMMSYGDIVTVTDNGDGTWTAEGSYKNVMSDPYGSFTITNVEKADLGGGSYLFATTGESIVPPTEYSISEPMTDTF